MSNPEELQRARVEAHHAFSKARIQAFWQRVWSTLTGKSIDLLHFEEVRQALRLRDERYLGRLEIELDKIVGSVGRYHDFTRTFLPRTNASQERWIAVSTVAQSSTGYPPIEVYKVGDVYFVIDGNHRVSVARQMGNRTIDAYVTDMPTSIPLDVDTNPNDLLIKSGYAEFLTKTRLDTIRPGISVILTEPDRYNRIIEHIDVHRYFMGLDQKRDVSYEEAVGSWYDNVYMPLIGLIREYKMLEVFAENRTETDLYAWLIKHQEAMRDNYGGEWMTPRETVDDFTAKLNGSL